MFRSLSNRVNSLKDSPEISYRIIYTLIFTAYSIKPFLLNARFRNERITKLLKGKKQYQVSTFTLENRYPRVFEIVKNILSDIPKAKIMSFGCSTGEEVSTLISYFPQATLMGVDINPWCIKQCKKNNHFSHCSFENYDSHIFKNTNEFDAIFCMAVFQNTKNREDQHIDYSDSFLFDDFEKELSKLDSKLKKGGVLAIDNSDFDFLDTKTSLNYQPYEHSENKFLRNRPLFGKQNQKKSASSNLYRIFIKMS